MSDITDLQRVLFGKQRRGREVNARHLLEMDLLRLDEEAGSQRQSPVDWVDEAGDRQAAGMDWGAIRRRTYLW